ncbi:MAG: flagellar biosynthesis protein FlhB [Alphaproteobacteria bacterium]
MADEQPERDERTEAPTSKRLEDARKDGQVPTSRDVTSLFILAVGLMLVSPMGAGSFAGLVPPLTSLLEHAHLVRTDPGSLAALMVQLMLALSAMLALPVAGFALAAVLANIAQHGLVCSLKPVTPKLQKISPLAGLKRLFAPKALAEALKNVAKVVLLGAVAWWAVSPLLVEVPATAAVPVPEVLAILQGMLLRGLGAALAVVVVVAIADYTLQRHSHWENLKMTRKQVRDENKQTEGDPHVKAKIRQLRTERSRRRMMQAVPEATVVVTNPTHFAVALKYAPETMKAPEVTAKGADALAFRIRALAREHRVPVVENRALARALYAEVEVGHTISTKHFEAAAEVIGFVMRQRSPGAGAA